MRAVDLKILNSLKLMCQILLFFAAYLICKKNYSFSRVVFFSDQNCPLFIQKEMTAVGLGQQGSQAVGSGFESLPCQKFFFIETIGTRNY